MFTIRCVKTHCFVSVFSLSAFVLLPAQELVHTNAAQRDWNTSSNWNTNTVPNAEGTQVSILRLSGSGTREIRLGGGPFTLSELNWSIDGINENERLRNGNLVFSSPDGENYLRFSGSAGGNLQIRNGGGLQVDTGQTLFLINESSAESSRITLTDNGAGGAFIGAGSIVFQDGSGMANDLRALRLANSSPAFTGTLVLDSGTIEFFDTNALPNALLATRGGRIVFDNDVALNSAIAFESGFVSLSSEDDDVSRRVVLNSDITGAGGVRVTPSVDLRLNGDNSFDGGIIIDGGRLRAGSDSAFGNGLVVVTDQNGIYTASGGPRYLNNDWLIEGELEVTGSSNPSVFAGELTGSGLLLKTSEQDLTIVGANAASLAVDLRSGTLILDSEPERIFSAFNASPDTILNLNDTRLSVNHSEFMDVRGEIIGSGDFIKSGVGTMLFRSSTKSFEGDLVLVSGTLQMTEGGQTTDVSSVRVESAAVLDLISTGDRNYNLGNGEIVMQGGTLRHSSGGSESDFSVLHNGLVFNVESAVDVVGESILDVRGDLSGAGNLIKQGSGILVLSGDFSAHTGQRIIEAGSIELGGSQLVGSAGIYFRVEEGAVSHVFMDLSGSGNFRTEGSGRINLRGDNSNFTGDYEVDSSRLNFASDTAAGSGGRIVMRGDRPSLSASNDATVILGHDLFLDTSRANIGASSGAELILDGVINGDASVRFASGNSGGGGLVLLNRQNSYGGHTTINNGSSGIIRLGIDNALPVTTELRFGNDDQNVGWLDLNGFDQEIAALETRNDPGFTVEGLQNSNLMQTSNFTVNQSADTVFTGAFEGGINLIKSGQGQLHLTRDSPNMQGRISILNGSLVINGEFDQADVDVAEFARLAGVMTVNNLQSAGILRPGNSPGDIIVLGDFTQAATGVLILDVEGLAVGQFDRLLITGTADLDGRLLPVFNDFIPSAGDTFTGFVQAGGGVTGSFILPSNPLIGYSQSVVGNNMDLQVDTVDFAPAALPLSRNERAVGEFLAAPGAAPGSARLGFAAMALSQTDADGVIGLYQGIAAEEYASLPETAFSSASSQLRTVRQRTADRHHLVIHHYGQIEASDWSTWFHLNFNRFERDRHDQVDGFRLNSRAVMAGFDKLYGNGFLTGFYGGYDFANIDFNSGRGQAEATTGLVGAQLAYFRPRYFVALTGQLNRHRYTMSRQYDFGIVDGNTEALQSSIELSGGLNVDFANWNWRPQTALTYSRFSANAFVETGANFAQQFSRISEHRSEFSIGMSANRQWELGSVNITPSFSFNYLRSLQNDPFVIRSSLIEGGPQLHVEGSRPGRDKFIFGSGITAAANPRSEAFANVEVEMGQSATRQYRAFLGWRWFL
jgi:fibronectin-binding autotransporter adhesin